MIRSPINRSGCQPPNSGREFLSVLRTRGKQGRLRSGRAGDFLVERSIHKKHEKRKKDDFFYFPRSVYFVENSFLFVSIKISRETIVPAVPGEPETGHVRAVFMKKNAEYGNYSADYPVTLA